MSSTFQMYITKNDKTALKNEAEKRGGAKMSFIVEEWAARFLKEGYLTPDESKAVSCNVAERGKGVANPLRTSKEAQHLLKKMGLKWGFNQVRSISLLVNRYSGQSGDLDKSGTPVEQLKK